MATSAGRQALLNNRCLNVADSGRSDRPPPLLPPPAGSSLSPPSSDSLRPNDGGDDTNKSFSLWPTGSSLPFSGERSSSLRSGEPPSQRLLPLPPRPRSIRRVLRRRRWITGLVVGLLVGLPATAHWVAKSLNFCRVAIFVYIYSQF